MSAELIQSISDPPQIERRRGPWISEETWRVIDTKVERCMDPTRYQTHTRVLGKQIKDLLNLDRRKFAAEGRAPVQ